MPPAPLLLVLIGTASAALAHTLWGRRWGQLILFWLAAMSGGLIAYAVGARIPLPLPMLTPAGVPVLEVVLAGWVLMFIASRLRI